MQFGWINGINLSVVIYLIAINIIVAGKGISAGFESKHLPINIFEQIGRYGCMALMILPIFTKEWKFGFSSVTEMLLWAVLTVLLLVLYSVLWQKKANGGAGVLYGLAVVPAILFLLNGILLRHIALIVAALLFGVFHFLIVRENIRVKH